MFVVSNNVKSRINLPEDTVIRINMAWVQSIPELYNIIEENKKYPVFLDFPKGRNKPPQPVLTFSDALKTMKKFSNIKYFAVSNSEDEKVLSHFRQILPQSIQIVPKIETALGIQNLLSVVRGAKSNIVMLDKEDLYSSVNKDQKVFTNLVTEIKQTSKNNNIIVLELQGVIFYGRE